MAKFYYNDIKVMEKRPEQPKSTHYYKQPLAWADRLRQHTQQCADNLVWSLTARMSQDPQVQQKMLDLASNEVSLIEITGDAKQWHRTKAHESGRRYYTIFDIISDLHDYIHTRQRNGQFQDAPKSMVDRWNRLFRDFFEWQDWEIEMLPISQLQPNCFQQITQQVQNLTAKQGAQ